MLCSDGVSDRLGHYHSNIHTQRYCEAILRNRIHTSLKHWLWSYWGRRYDIQSIAYIENGCSGIAGLNLQSSSMMLTMAVELPTTMVKDWLPSRAMLSSTTRSVKSVQPLELDGLTVTVALVPKSSSV